MLRLPLPWKHPWPAVALSRDVEARLLESRACTCSSVSCPRHKLPTTEIARRIGAA